MCNDAIVKVFLVSLMLNCAGPGVHASVSFDMIITGPGWSDEENWNLPEYYSTIGFLDVNGDHYKDVCGRSPTGMVCHLNRNSKFTGETTTGPVWTDEGGWNRPEHYSTIKYVDINYDLRPDICGRSALGIECYISAVGRKPSSWPPSNQVYAFANQRIRGPSWSDAEGWSLPEYYSTIRYVNINGDDFPDICARGPSGIECYLNTGGAFSTEVIRGPNWSDAEGWNRPEYYSTIRYPIGKNGQRHICGRSTLGIECYATTPGGETTTILMRYRKYVMRHRNLATQGGWSSTLVLGPGLSDSLHWNNPSYYSTLRYVDVNQDTLSDLCIRSSDGLRCYLNRKASSDQEDGEGLFGNYFTLQTDWSDSKNFSSEKYYSTIEVGHDINGDNKPDFCARSSSGIRCYIQRPIPEPVDGVRENPTYYVVSAVPELSDSEGWDRPEYYSTIKYLDFSLDGRNDICARAPSGIKCYINTSPKPKYYYYGRGTPFFK